MEVDAAKVLGVLRAGVGALSWVSPAASWSTFGLGPIEGDANAGLVTRLFGSRDFVLAQMVLCPDARVRRAGLQAGISSTSTSTSSPTGHSTTCARCCTSRRSRQLIAGSTSRPIRSSSVIVAAGVSRRTCTLRWSTPTAA